MDLTDQQLAVILQACVDFAGQLLEQDGGFHPFGARAKLDGEIEFMQFPREGATASLEDLYRRTSAALADDARRNEICAAALIANVSIPDQPEGAFPTAVEIRIEAPNFCRSITVPYRHGAENPNGKRAAVEFGKMIPQAAEHVVFVG